MPLKKEEKKIKRAKRVCGTNLLLLLRLAASRVLRFFSSCLFSKNRLLLHSWMTPALMTSLRNRLRSLSSGSFSSTTTCTLYADRKKSVFACAWDGFATADSSADEWWSWSWCLARSFWSGKRVMMGGGCGFGGRRKEKRVEKEDEAAIDVGLECEVGTS